MEVINTMENKLFNMISLKDKKSFKEVHKSGNKNFNKKSILYSSKISIISIIFCGNFM